MVLFGWLLVYSMKTHIHVRLSKLWNLTLDVRLVSCVISTIFLTLRIFPPLVCTLFFFWLLILSYICSLLVSTIRLYYYSCAFFTMLYVNQHEVLLVKFHLKEIFISILKYSPHITIRLYEVILSWAVRIIWKIYTHLWFKDMFVRI